MQNIADGNEDKTSRHILNTVNKYKFNDKKQSYVLINKKSGVNM